MAKQPKASIRTIAAMTGLSRATVANALNGTPTVAKATAERVRAVAEQMGYRRNPMVGSLMSAMRLSQGSGLKGVLAVAEIEEPERPTHGQFHKDLLEGCRSCAEELGFKVEYHLLRPEGLTPERLSTMLRARGIRGLIVLPAWTLPDFSRFDWGSFTGIYADYIPHHPELNTVCCDHYRSVLELLELLEERGYRRPGIVLEKGRDERIDLRMSAACLAFYASRGIEPVTPLISGDITEPVVLNWIQELQPDVVLSHHTDVLEWMKQSGCDVPNRMGFVGLNLTKTSEPCAGLDLRPKEIGRSAVENLVAQIQRQAWGRPSSPRNTTILGAFIDGPTLRV